jgi:hypothetical protein
MSSRKYVYLGIAALLAASAARADVEASRCVVRGPLSLPVAELTGYASTLQGMLFVADRTRVFVRSPWAWEQVWSAPNPSINVQALGMVRGADDEAVIIAVDNSLVELTWTRERKPGRPWSVFHLTFHTRTISAGGTHGFRAIHRNSDEAVARGYVEGDNGTLTPLIFDGTLRAGKEIPIPGASPSTMWYAGRAGWSYANGYRASTLVVLSPSGTVAASYDLERVLDPANQLAHAVASIQSVAIDPGRNWLVVGTYAGACVARLQGDSGSPAPPFLKIAKLGLEDIQLVAIVLGRAMFLIRQGQLGPMVWEAGNPAPERDIAEFTRNFRVRTAWTGQHPGEVSAAVQIDDDAIWASSYEGLWEWTPAAWRFLGNGDALPEPDASRLRPLIAKTILGNQLQLWTPRLWSTTFKQGAFPFAALATDPSGDGVWALEQSAAGSSVTAGEIRFLTPHGSVDATDGTSGGDQRFEVARLATVRIDGTVDSPESAKGGMLLPHGLEWIHGIRGESRLLTMPEGLRLSGMLPGARSSHTAWLGVQASGSGSRAVRFDVADDGVRLSASPTEAACASAAESRLVPDDAGFVWLACRRDGAWLFQRVDAASDRPAESFTARSLQEPPQLIFHDALSTYVLTSHGVLEHSLTSDGPWRPILPRGEPGSATVTMPGYLAPSFSRQLPSVPGLWTLLMGSGREGDLFSNAGEAYDLDASPSGAKISAFRDFQGATGRPLVSFFASQGTSMPGLLVWGAKDNEDRAIAEWFVRNERNVPETWHEDIPGLGDPRDAAVFDPSQSPRGGDLTSSIPMFAVTDGSWTAIRRDPESWNSSHTPISVPVELTFFESNGKAHRYSLQDSFPSGTLAFLPARGQLRVAWDYEDWWRDTYSRVQFRELSRPGYEWNSVRTDGTVEFGLSPATEYNLQLRVPDRFGVGILPLQSLTFKTPAARAPLPSWFYPLVSAAAATIALAVSARLRRRLLILLGRRWLFITGDCQHLVRIENSGSAVRVSMQGVQGDEAREMHLVLEKGANCDADALAAIRPSLRAGEDVRVTVDEELFFCPWAAFIGGRWSEGLKATVAGQIASIQPRAPSVRRPPRSLRAAILGYGSESGGLPELPEIESEMRAIARQFHNWGSTPDIVGNCRKAAFFDSLRNADFVHFAGHASFEGVRLEDGWFTAGDLTEELLVSMRCRLLVLSACELGRIAPGDGSFVFELVRAGVNVLATRLEVDSVVCEAFLSQFYAAFLPGRRAQRIAVSDAIRQAAAACDKRFAHITHHDWRQHVDGFMLYGDPTFQIVLGNPRKAATP